MNGLSCCGTDCSKCGCYGNLCKGCNECKGEGVSAQFIISKCQIWYCKKTTYFTCFVLGQTVAMFERIFPCLLYVHSVKPFKIMEMFFFRKNPCRTREMLFLRWGIIFPSYKGWYLHVCLILPIWKAESGWQKNTCWKDVPGLYIRTDVPHLRPETLAETKCHSINTDTWLKKPDVSEKFQDANDEEKVVSIFAIRFFAWCAVLFSEESMSNTRNAFFEVGHHFLYTVLALHMAQIPYKIHYVQKA